MKTEFRSVLIELLNDSNKPNQRKAVFELLSKHLTQSKTSYDSLTEFASLLIDLILSMAIKICKLAYLRGLHVHFTLVS